MYFSWTSLKFIQSQRKYVFAVVIFVLVQTMFSFKLMLCWDVCRSKYYNSVLDFVMHPTYLTGPIALFRSVITIACNYVWNSVSLPSYLRFTVVRHCLSVQWWDLESVSICLWSLRASGLSQIKLTCLTCLWRSIAVTYLRFFPMQIGIQRNIYNLALLVAHTK